MWPQAPLPSSYNCNWHAKQCRPWAANFLKERAPQTSQKSFRGKISRLRGLHQALKSTTRRLYRNKYCPFLIASLENRSKRVLKLPSRGRLPKCREILCKYCQNSKITICWQMDRRNHWVACSPTESWVGAQPTRTTKCTIRTHWITFQKTNSQAARPLPILSTKSPKIEQHL